MLTKQELCKIFNKLSSIIGHEICIHKEKLNEEADNQKSNSYNFFLNNVNIDGQNYVLSIKGQNSLTKREIDIINFFLKESLTLKGDMTIKAIQNEVVGLLNDDLGEKEAEQLLVKMGFSPEHQLIVVVVKLFGEVEVKEISSIIDNIASNNIVQAQIKEDLLVVLYQPIKEEKVQLANFIVDAVETELFGKIKIGISLTKCLNKVKLAYTQGMEALNIGIKYQLPGSIYFYSELREYRVLSKLSDGEIQDFYEESISLGIDRLSEEELKTASIFIDSNLNISEAARRLYIHRNTLNYRLDKIQKDTGFDLRTFKDAFDFKIFLTIYQIVKYKRK